MCLFTTSRRISSFHHNLPIFTSRMQLVLLDRLSCMQFNIMRKSFLHVDFAPLRLLVLYDHSRVT